MTRRHPSRYEHSRKYSGSGIKTASVTASDSVTATVPVVMVKASTRITLDTPEVTDTEAQHSAAVDAAEAQRQSLIDAAMASISLIQLKLQAGRKLTQAETTRLNAVLDYIDAVTATDTSTAPDVIWPELPEA
ncbi:tail fiber assembly [Escherichia coli]|nr:tail fiber assembly [Escherichia coli]